MHHRAARLVLLCSLGLSVCWTPLLARAGGSPVPAVTPGHDGHDATQGQASDFRGFVTAVQVNGAPVGEWLLADREGRLHAPAEALHAWRILLPPGIETWEAQGQSWVPLDRLPGFESRSDESTQTLLLSFDPGVFDPARIAPAQRKQGPVAAREHALFLNYDASLMGSRSRPSDWRQDLGSLFELGWTGPAGVLTSSHAARNLASGQRSIRRLETAFTHDAPGSYITWRLGDTSTRASLWAPPALYGGLQVGRNWRLNPSFIARPIPVLAGTASVPSTLELYVNDALRQVSQVPSGPFTLDGLTGLTSSGQARLVLRDPLGRETVVVQDFFSHTALLDQGLTDWSLESGALRRGFGGPNDGYGSAFGAGLWRHGLSKTTTLEGRLELDRRRQAAGAGVSATLNGYWFVQGALATSHGETGNGTRWTAQVEADPLRQRFAARLEGSSRGFRQLGQSSAVLPARLQASLGVALLADRDHSLRLFAGQVQMYEGPASRTSGIVYSRNIGRSGFFSVSANQIRTAGQSARSVMATWVFPWDSLQTSGQLARRDGHLEPMLMASRSPIDPSEPGWRAATGSRAGAAFAEGGIFAQTRYAWLAGDLSTSRDRQALRLGARGGLVAMDGSVFATSRLDESFALVEVGQLAGVGVGFQGYVPVVTDSRGRALLPRLQPFVPNNVNLDPNSLPVTADLDSTQQTITPSRRSAVRLRFPVRSGLSALLQIVFDDGEPAPLGALVHRVDDPEEFMVARHGEAYVSGLQNSDQVELRWKGMRCRIEVTVPTDQGDDIQKLGPLLCKGVKR